MLTDANSEKPTLSLYFFYSSILPSTLITCITDGKQHFEIFSWWEGHAFNYGVSKTSFRLAYCKAKNCDIKRKT